MAVTEAGKKIRAEYCKEKCLTAVFSGSCHKRSRDFEITRISVTNLYSMTC